MGEAYLNLITRVGHIHSEPPPDSGGNGTPVWPLLVTVFSSILEVFILCFAGWVLARQGILDKKTQKQLNRLNVSLFTPALLFSKVAFALSPQKLKELWIIPIFFVVVTTVSALVAWILGYLFRIKRTQRNFAIAAAMFNNSNSLPIALMQSLVITVKGLKWDKGDTKDSMLGRALTYLVLYSTLGMMLRWSFGVHLLSQADDEAVPDEPEMDDEEPLLRHQPSVTFTNAEDEVIPSTSARSSTSSVAAYNQRGPPQGLSINPPPPHFLDAQLRTASQQLLEADARHQGRPLPKRKPTFFYSFPNSPTRSRANLLSSSTSVASTVISPNPERNEEWGDQIGSPTTTTIPTSTRWQSFVRRTKRKIRRFFKTLNEFMTIPMWAAIASLIVACVRPFQHALEQHMQPVKGSLVSAGNCSIPITLIVLGAYFYTPADADKSRSLPRTVTEPDSEVHTNGVNGHAEGEGSNRRRSWASMMSVSTLTDSLKGAFKMSGKNSSSSRRKSSVEQSRKGETTTVFVAIISRMIITPAILLPFLAGLAWFDLHKVMDDPVFVVSFVLLVSSPPALTLAQITQAASGDAFERLISRTIFWSYCVFTPPLTILYVVIGLLMSNL